MISTHESRSSKHTPSPGRRIVNFFKSAGASLLALGIIACNAPTESLQDPQGKCNEYPLPNPSFTETKHLVNARRTYTETIIASDQAGLRRYTAIFSDDDGNGIAASAIADRLKIFFIGVQGNTLEEYLFIGYGSDVVLAKESSGQVLSIGGESLSVGNYQMKLRDIIPNSSEPSELNSSLVTLAFVNQNGVEKTYTMPFYPSYGYAFSKNTITTDEGIAIVLNLFSVDPERKTVDISVLSQVVYITDETAGSFFINGTYQGRSDRSFDSKDTRTGGIIGGFERDLRGLKSMHLVAAQDEIVRYCDYFSTPSQ